jgi:hypothetical protein
MNPEQLTQWADPIGAVIGFVLTLMVLSYIIGDNFLFRLAIHIFIGVASGYAAVLIFYNVLWNQVMVPLLQVFMQGAPSGLLANVLRILPALLLGGWMLTKASPRLARLGTPVLAFLVGVGAATVMGGALFGTLIPQVSATAGMLDLDAAPAETGKLVGWFISGIFILVGTVTTLSYFQFGVRSRMEGAAPTRPPFIESMATIGQGFIAITLGVFFAGVLAAALVALVDRARFLWQVIQSFLS